LPEKQRNAPTTTSEPGLQSACRRRWVTVYLASRRPAGPVGLTCRIRVMVATEAFAAAEPALLVSRLGMRRTYR
jgi:hypothetical protein